MKKTTTTIPAGTSEERDGPDQDRAIVAPASGIRSRIATISPSATA